MKPEEDIEEVDYSKIDPEEYYWFKDDNDIECLTEVIPNE